MDLGFSFPITCDWSFGNIFLAPLVVPFPVIPVATWAQLAQQSFISIKGFDSLPAVKA